MTDIPPCPWCGRQPKAGIRDGKYASLSCMKWLTPAWKVVHHDIEVWAFTKEGARHKWRRLVEKLKEEMA